MAFTSKAEILSHESNLWLASVKKPIEPETNQQSTSLCLYCQLEPQETIAQEDTYGKILDV